jgi:hypothetical protein
LAPHTVVTGYTGRSPSAYKFAKDWNEQTEIAKEGILREEKAAKRMKKWADKDRRPAHFNIGDLVQVKLQPNQLRVYRKVQKGLIGSMIGLSP